MNNKTQRFPFEGQWLSAREVQALYPAYSENVLRLRLRDGAVCLADLVRMDQEANAARMRASRKAAKTAGSQFRVSPKGKSA